MTHKLTSPARLPRKHLTFNLSRLTLLSLFTLSVLLGCDNELDEYDPTYFGDNAKPFYVVYGILNPQDSVQSIRLAQAFQTEGDRIVYAQENDLTVQNASVLLREYSFSQSSPDTVWGKTIQLQPERITRETDIFYPEMTVYRTREQIEHSRFYRLEIQTFNENSPDDSVFVTADTYVPRSADIQIPTGPRPGPGQDSIISEAAFEASQFRIQFRSPYLSRYGEVVPPEGAAAGFNIQIQFRYETQGTPQQEVFRLRQPIDLIVDETGTQSSYVCRRSICYPLGRSFFDYLRSNLRDVPEITYDESEQTTNQSCQINVISIDEHLYNYMRATNPTFIDFTTIRPEYTNLSAGLGVFGSINVSEDRYVQLTECAKYLLELNGRQFSDRPAGCDI